MRSPRPPRRLLLGAAVALVVVLVAGAGAAVALRPDETKASHRAEATRILQHAQGTGEVPAASEALKAQVSTAGGLRVGLRVLLSRHVSVTARTLDGSVAGAADLEAQARVLRSNSQDLAAAIALIYGEAGGRAFDELWSQHAQFLVAYGTARGEGDAAAATTARSDLGHYHQDFTSFCNLATGLPEPAVEELIGGHLDRLLDYTDAVAAGTRAASADHLDQALVEVATIADALATAIAGQHPDLFPGTLDDPATERLATTVSSVERAAALTVEAHRAGRPSPAVAVDGLGPATSRAWADLLDAAAADGPPPTSAGLARAAADDGLGDDVIAAVVDAADTWLVAVTDHRRAVDGGDPEEAVAASDRVETTAVDLGVALAGTIPA